MRNAIWHSWSRLSGVLFPATAVALFFTPQDSAYVALLAMTALASGGTWIYLRDKRE